MTTACGSNPELPVPGGDFVQPTGWYGSRRAGRPGGEESFGPSSGSPLPSGRC